MEPFRKYKDLIDIQNVELNKYLKIRNVITTVKIVLFLLICFSIYKWIAFKNVLFGYITFPSIIFYIILNLKETGILAKISYCKMFIKCIESELSYLKGNFSPFSNGEEYIDPHHPYSMDLDLFGPDSLFQALNRCETMAGKNLFADLIKNITTDSQTIKLRQQAIDELSENIDLCLNLRTTILNHPVATISEINIDAWKKAPYFISRKYFNYIIYFSNLLMISLIICSFFIPHFTRIAVYYFIFQLCITLLYSTRINKSQSYLGAFIKGFGNYLFPISLLKGINFKSELNINISDKLFGKYNSLKEFSDLKSIMEALDNRANLLITIILDGLFMRDIHTMIKLDIWRKKNIDMISVWIDSVSQIEVLVSFAIYKFNSPKNIFPEIKENEIISARNIYHPLLFYKTPVSNDFNIQSLHQLDIVTGANMSGKSTFLRTIGINWILAHCGSTVSADSFFFTPMKLFTSMRTSDNLSSGTSYFHAEILRLRSLVDMAEANDRLFIILDEILKGTNSLDKLNGSRQLILKLIKLPVAGIIATHDLELGELEALYPNNIFNICFEVETVNDDLVYDYKLKPGVSQNMNASFLLKKYGLV